MAAAVKVIRCLLRPRERPFLLISPDVLAHDVNSHRARRRRVRCLALKLVVEPCNAGCKTGLSIRPCGLAIGKSNGIRVSPGADNDAAFSGHALVGLAADGFIIPQLTR